MVAVCIAMAAVTWLSAPQGNIDGLRISLVKFGKAQFTSKSLVFM